MIQAALIGAGARGMHAYASYALKNPQEIKFIAVAEENRERREKFAKDHSIPIEMQFSSWEQLLDNPRLCEALLICTQDRMHYEPTMKAIRQGYKILLEKPMSPIPKESLEMAEEAEKYGSLLSVCHGMRYSTYYRALKRILEEETIGKVTAIQWNENVGVLHHSHSFVRGNWRNSKESSPMILQKSCHDMDMLQWLVNADCVKVSSFGSLSYFKEENAPKGSTARCTDGCQVERDCPFSAIKMYLNEKDEWPANVVTLEPKYEKRLKALQEGPYGRCVYRCDNDVVDHQVVNLLFDNEVTVAFTMSAFTNEISRTFKIMGTKGEIRGNHYINEIEIKYFSGRVEKVYPEKVEGGHDGADTLIMEDFIKQVRSNENKSHSSGIVSAKSHLIAFAAEESRVTGKTIDMNEYVTQLRKSSTVV
ncbi:Gfo/Idh/MocA family oxidoreductase [Bacillus sp. FJAT-49732]|uniref:Gfo/Idh/MocA family oxidoreductase n=1 Tax=Lederbergia citrisecunda TaxID=2833583 RepID=A0A942YJK1_9BACI|nr:Gfo/Idh/MocA family oxidoreductase [Lederbergia citrisecunda]MBS4198199.1 Gfo/Idh/MocA family oxidoreductase [Lederbergia citrisecunda]